MEVTQSNYSGYPWSMVWLSGLIEKMPISSAWRLEPVAVDRSVDVNDLAFLTIDTHGIQ
jgi:hypothetical protein